MKCLRLLSLLPIAMVLTACSGTGLGGHDKDYANAVELPPLKTPAGIPSPVNEGYYVVPNYPISPKLASNVTIIPPGSHIVEIQKTIHHHDRKRGKLT